MTTAHLFLDSGTKRVIVTASTQPDYVAECWPVAVLALLAGQGVIVLDYEAGAVCDEVALRLAQQQAVQP
jgi:hypothetical protein